jgi:hypothetical protein
MLTFDQQLERFESLQVSIDRELRVTGFEDVFRQNDIDPTLGRLVVGRAFTETAITPDLDPFSLRMETFHEVGVYRTKGSRRTWSWLPVSQAIHGEAQQPLNLIYLDYIQVATVNCAVQRLLSEKTQGLLPYLTKSLKKIDPAGD